MIIFQNFTEVREHTETKNIYPQIRSGKGYDALFMSVFFLFRFDKKRTHESS